MMMSITRVSLLSLALTSMGGCANAANLERPDLTVDGQATSYDDATAQLTIEADRDVLEVRLVDHGPANTVDGGMVYQFRIELASGVPANTSLEVVGDAMLVGHDTGGGRFETSFVASATHDARVLGIYTTTECFCASPMTQFQERVTGTIDVIDRHAGTMVVGVDIEVDGTIPGGFAPLPSGNTPHRFHVVGRVEASVLTR